MGMTYDIALTGADGKSRYARVGWWGLPGEVGTAWGDQLGNSWLRRELAWKLEARAPSGAFAAGWGFFCYWFPPLPVAA